MSETILTSPAPQSARAFSSPVGARIQAGLAKRRAAEKRFQWYGVLAVAFAVFCLLFLFSSIIGNALPGLQQTTLTIPITFEREVIDPDNTGEPKIIARADYRGLAKTSLRAMFPDVKNRRDKRKLYGLISSGSDFVLRDLVLADPSLIGKTIDVKLLASDDVDQFHKGAISDQVEESARRISDKEIAWIRNLAAQKRLDSEFNTTLFSAGDSREPELAGFLGAIVGSVFAMLVTILLAFPIGVAAAVYLEEFAPKNFWMRLIEVNINNLAAVPSIVFGLLGLAVFLNFMQFPRSAPLVGGMVLALMTLPTVIIAGRAALMSVPPSIREAALGLGASQFQTVAHHILPLAFPGVLTGTIIGMARALGETAPLLMIGMVAFIVDIPSGVTDPATVMPVQIYLWADSPERAFVEKTAAGTMILVGFLVLMNGLAIVLRKKFEHNW